MARLGGRRCTPCALGVQWWGHQPHSYGVVGLNEGWVTVIDACGGRGRRLAHRPDAAFAGAVAGAGGTAAAAHARRATSDFAYAVVKQPLAPLLRP